MSYSYNLESKTDYTSWTLCVVWNNETSNTTPCQTSGRAHRKKKQKEMRRCVPTSKCAVSPANWAARFSVLWVLRGYQPFSDMSDLLSRHPGVIGVLTAQSRDNTSDWQPGLPPLNCSSVDVPQREPSTAREHSTEALFLSQYSPATKEVYRGIYLKNTPRSYWSKGFLWHEKNEKNKK